MIAFITTGIHTGTLRTPLGPVAPTGRPIRQRVTDILTVRDGRVADIWVIGDELGLLMSLDAVRLTTTGEGSPADPGPRPTDAPRS